MIADTFIIYPLESGDYSSVRGKSTENKGWSVSVAVLHDEGSPEEALQINFFIKIINRVWEKLFNILLSS